MRHSARWLFVAVSLVLVVACGGSDGSGGGPTFPSTDPLRWSAAPASLTFAAPVPGVAQTLSVVVRNESTAATGTLSSAVLPGSEFTLVGVTFPIVLAPLQQTTFDVRYEPTDASSDSGTVRLLEASGGPEARVPVSAGTPPSVGAEVIQDFGPQPLVGGLTPTLQVDVPADAVSLSIEASMPGSAIGLLEWTGPGGKVYENVFGTGEYIWAPGLDVALFGLPNTDRESGRLVPGGGTYSFRLMQMGGGGGTMSVRAIVERREAAAADLGRLDLNVWLANALAPSAATAATDLRLQTVLAEISDILSQQGVTLGDVDYYDVTNPAFDRVSDTEFPTLLTLTTAATEERLNLFFVVEAIGGGVVGVSPTVGGPKRNGTTSSGVMSVYDAGFSASLIGLIAAHEIGHYLGLQHTAERDGGHDYVDDTLECPGEGTDGTCPVEGGGYLMHWQAVGGSDLTDGQGLVVRGHPHGSPVPSGLPLLEAARKVRGSHAAPEDAYLLGPGWCGTCATGWKHGGR